MIQFDCWTHNKIDPRIWLWQTHLQSGTGRCSQPYLHCGKELPLSFQQTSQCLQCVGTQTSAIEFSVEDEKHFKISCGKFRESISTFVIPMKWVMHFTLLYCRKNKPVIIYLSETIIIFKCRTSLAPLLMTLSYKIRKALKLKA